MVDQLDHLRNWSDIWGWKLWSKVKNDHRSKFSNLSNWKEEAWKNQGFNGIRTHNLYDTSAIPEVTGSNPVEALIFSGFFFPIA